MLNFDSLWSLHLVPASIFFPSKTVFSLVCIFLCISYIFLFNTLSQILVNKATNIYYLTVLKLSPLGVNTSRSYNQGLIEAVVIPRLHQGMSGSSSTVTQVVVVRIQFIPVYWNEGLSSLLAIDQRLSSLSCLVDLLHSATHNIEIGFNRGSK